MTAAIIFTLLLALLLFRAFVLHLRATDLDNPRFQALPRESRLAILKERILESPSEKNLNNLGAFLLAEGIHVDMESYRPLLAEQLRISRQENAIALDNDLYIREAEWMDKISPFEFEIARKQKEDGNIDEFIRTYLQGVLRYYSDEKIEEALQNLTPDFPQAAEMLNAYRQLERLRDESPADETSIEKLALAKKEWMESLLHFISERKEQAN
ncbi:hypothetical protein [uncultured Fibrobacter sp.]|uniref:hypothetical protein n=1 Tax=uncultured Fibrobacter sp. TaxID=261512 RepID=UPI00280470BE|nr:hypothetical protein [uncultured Fibrobacter sp.]